MVALKAMNHNKEMNPHEISREWFGQTVVRFKYFGFGQFSRSFNYFYEFRVGGHTIALFEDYWMHCGVLLSQTHALDPQLIVLLGLVEMESTRGCLSLFNQLVILCLSFEFSK